jgi:hypothetical protein
MFVNEKWNFTSKCVCAQSINKIITMQTLNNTRIFVDEVKTQLREKPLQGSQTQDIHYSKDKASYKVVQWSYIEL